MQTILALTGALLTGLGQPDSERPHLQFSVTIHRAAVNDPIGPLPPRRLAPEERAQVIVCPPVATVPGKPASVFVGQDVPRMINTVRRVMFVPQGLSLQIVPKAIMKDSAVLEMVLENSEGGDNDRMKITLGGTFVLDQPILLEWPIHPGDRRITARVIVEAINR